MLTREGWDKRTYRIYRDLGLQLRKKTPKRRVKAKLREGREEAVDSNDVWAMDFVHDQLATGKKIRVLTIVDTFSRYVPVLDPRFSYRAEDVVRTLEQVCPKIGFPKTIRVDQCSEFVSRDLDLWAYAKGVTLDFSRPGKPTDNAYIEAFNGRFRAECLNAHWFLTLPDAAEKLEDWRRYYNEVRRMVRSRCSITMAPPARHREGPETLPSGGPKNGIGAERRRSSRASLGLVVIVLQHICLENLCLPGPVARCPAHNRPSGRLAPSPRIAETHRH